MERAYLSNLSPLWPIARQREMLSEAVPGARLYVDELAPKDRQGRRADLLQQRGILLRPTTRPAAETITLAVLPVLDWTVGGMLACLARAHARGATVRCLVPPLLLPPTAGAAELARAVEAFRAARTRERAEARGKLGGAVAGRKRLEAARAKAELISERWKYGDRREHRTADLLAEVGLTYNTAKKHLGARKS